MASDGSGAGVAAAVDWSRVPANAVAYDVVYSADTPFLVAARARGLVTRDGHGMLSGQAALALSLWLEMPSPFAIMRAALDEVIAASAAAHPVAGAEI